MTNYDFDYNEKAKLMCLFTEIASISRPLDHYGYFMISRFWCLDPRRPGSNNCHVNCADLGDPTFRKDVRCAYKILIIEGVTAWGGYGLKCLGSDLTKYIPQCV
ncbi:lysozyme C-2-like [Rana temporaria]|uniref:lysozyme C-2-like n=1 Tax=Rana temporaria TaxID=8407 RepID=UPI001AAD963B|nr:lysozyme C-2-like [Rana temporaria]